MEYLGTLALVVIGWALAVFALCIAGQQIYQFAINFSRRSKSPRKTKFDKAIEKAMLDLDRWEYTSRSIYNPYLETTVKDSKTDCSFNVKDYRFYLDDVCMNVDPDKVGVFLFSLKNREVAEKLNKAYVK